MKRWLLILEGPALKVSMVIFWGFSVGYAINKEWTNAIEPASIGLLLFFIYRWGKKIDRHLDEDD